MIKVCPICKKEHNKSGLTCSKDCYKILWKKKVEESNLKKYGVKNVFQLESVKNKMIYLIIFYCKVSLASSGDLRIPFVS